MAVLHVNFTVKRVRSREKTVSSTASLKDTDAVDYGKVRKVTTCLTGVNKTVEKPHDGTVMLGTQDST